MTEAQKAYHREYYRRNKARLDAKSKAYYQANKGTLIARAKANYKKWATAHPERILELKRKYTTASRHGLTIDEYEKMVALQDGRCAICDELPRKRRLSIDHHHTSGQIRQLLCSNCNSMLGHAREDPKILARAIEYLRSHASRGAA